MKLHAFLLAMVGAVVLAGSAVPAEAQYHHHHYHHHHYHPPSVNQTTDSR
jgi:hypothetical protein